MDGVIEILSRLRSGIRASFDVVVLLRFNAGRSLAVRGRLSTSDAVLAPTCDILSSGVTSASMTVGKLCLRHGLSGFDRAPPRSALTLSSTTRSGLCVDAVGPYT